MSRKNKELGNVVMTVLILATLAILVAAGIYIYKHGHDTEKTAKPTSSTDSYAGWESYCDNTYHYCFKYPASWTIDANTATGIGHTAQTTLLNNSKTTAVSYINAFAHDSGPIAFTPTYINKIKSANEDLTVVGGFSPASGLVGNYLPTYKVVDGSLLTTYPLVVNQQSQFPNNPSFTDQNTGNVSYQGALTAGPATSINTTADAQTWLNSSDAKTALLILESLYYQK